MLSSTQVNQRRNCNRHPGVASLANSSPMENAMCWEMDYQFFAEQKKAQENKIKENQAKDEQRDKLIAKLLDDAKVQAKKPKKRRSKRSRPRNRGFDLNCHLT
jgi:hypothetical protein